VPLNAQSAKPPRAGALEVHVTRVAKHSLIRAVALAAAAAGIAAAAGTAVAVGATASHSSPAAHHALADDGIVNSKN
jgi:hypothetical protein